VASSRRENKDTTQKAGGSIVDFVQEADPKDPEDGMANTEVQDLLDGLELGHCAQAFLDQGFDSTYLLRNLNQEEWAELKQVCRLRAGDAAKLRLALGRP